MRKWFRSGIALAVSLTILGGCGADRESASPVDSTLDLASVANDCPGGVISQDIAQIFPTQKSLRHVATVNCGQIFKDFEKGKQQEAIQKAFVIADSLHSRISQAQQRPHDPCLGSAAGDSEDDVGVRRLCDFERGIDRSSEVLVGRQAGDQDHIARQGTEGRLEASALHLLDCRRVHRWPLANAGLVTLPEVDPAARACRSPRVT